MDKVRSYLRNKRLLFGLYLAPAIAAFSIALVMIPGIRPGAIDGPADSSADVVIGQPDMASNNIDQQGFSHVLSASNGIYSDGTKLFICDYRNGRVLIFNSIPTANYAGADMIVGQPTINSLGSNQGGSASARTLRGPSGVITVGNKLIVSDNANNRVLIYNTIPTALNTAADVVIGQSDMTTVTANTGGVSASSLNGPGGLYSDGTKLYVCDAGNNRVLVFNSIPTSNNASANLVFGQPDFVSNTAGVTAQLMSGPGRIYSDGTKLFVCDGGNNRVLIYNTIPAASNPEANVVVGQADMVHNGVTSGGLTKGLWIPSGVFSDGIKLYISDTTNHRVLIYDSIPTSHHAAANTVLGQADFTTRTDNFGGVSASTLSYPNDIIVAGGKLFISEYNNNRVKIYNSASVTTNEASDVVVGQGTMTYNNANGLYTQANQLYNPWGICKAGSKLLIVDRRNERVLIHNTVPSSNNAPADVVIGQTDMHRTYFISPSDSRFSTPRGISSDGTKIALADHWYHRVLIYNSIPESNNAPADVVIGQTNMNTNEGNSGGLSANSLALPHNTLFIGSKLVVSDYGNNRVLIYNSVPTSNFAAADVVIGQPDMTSNTANNGGVSAASLSAPTGICSDGTRLFIADNGNSRILIYNSIPTTNHVSADIVIGQTAMTSNTANSGGISAASLYGSADVFTDGQRLYIADSGNNRVLVFSSIPTADHASADMVIGQPDMSSGTANNGGISSRTLNYPTSVYSDGSKIYIADYENNRVLIYDVTSVSPTISDIKFNDVAYVSGDTTNSSPAMKATLTETGGTGVDISKVKITVDSVLYTYASFEAATDSYNSTTGLMTFKIKTPFSTGTHAVKIEVSDYYGNWGTWETDSLTVKDSSGSVAIEGTPLNYPNPFNTSTGSTAITYKLTIDSDIMIYIFDVRGVLIKKTNYSSGSTGGKAGYNEVTWDGKDDFGSTVGNGIYPYRIVRGGRVLGRGKIAVLE